ncbi:hypothetical protein Gpo141_00006015 [Globisporangium polare]
MRVFRSLFLLVLAAVAAAPAAQAQNEKQQIYSKLDEKEPEVSGCPMHFTREMRPVCASNGQVYSNPSIFKYHQCRAEKLHRIKLATQDMALCDQRREL